MLRDFLAAFSVTITLVIISSCTSTTESQTNGCAVGTPPCAVADPQLDCSIECELHGLCKKCGHDCVAYSNSDCTRSDACNSVGQCTMCQGKCVVASDDDCQKGSLCMSQGRCEAIHGKCEWSISGCKLWQACREGGYCTYFNNTGRYGPSGYIGCVIGSDADCEQSNDCKNNGYCKSNEKDNCCRPDGKCAVDK